MYSTQISRELNSHSLWNAVYAIIDCLHEDCIIADLVCLCNEAQDLGSIKSTQIILPYIPRGEMLVYLMIQRGDFIKGFRVDQRGDIS